MLAENETIPTNNIPIILSIFRQNTRNPNIKQIKLVRYGKMYGWPSLSWQ